MTGSNERSFERNSRLDAPAVDVDVESGGADIAGGYPARSPAELKALVERLAERIGRALERQGVLARDAESRYLEVGPDAGGAMRFIGRL
jgi:hypothetical protein